VAEGGDREVVVVGDVRHGPIIRAGGPPAPGATAEHVAEVSEPRARSSGFASSAVQRTQRATLRREQS
jgi:hypothetical protein